MRGKAFDSPKLTFSARITPAHAGKSFLVAGYIKSVRDHPRTCGEKDDIENIYLNNDGSPPHMRGKDTTGNLLELLTRITPAHAGKRV